MPAGRPTHREVHVDSVLTNISEGYIQKEASFIANKVFPSVPVQKQSDLYYKYDKGDFFRDEAQIRAPGTESAGGGYTVSTDTYLAQKYAFHKDIDDETRANTDSPLNPDRDATTFVTQKLLIKRERIFVDKFFKAGVWTTDVTGVAGAPAANQVLQWNDAASNPVKDISDYKTRVAELTGFVPNVLVLGPKVVNALKENADIIDRIKYTQKGIITAEMLAGLFEVEEVLMPQAVVNTANQGAADAISFIYGKSALLLHRTRTPSLWNPSAGYIFPWAGLYGANAYGGRIKNFRMENIEADRIEGEMAFDMKVVAADLGVFFSTIVA